MPVSLDIQHAACILRNGGIVAFPTETVYGLGADCFNPAAVARVFALKGRPSNNPLIVHVSSESMARQVVNEWPPDAGLLADAFWPGPLSIVLPRNERLPSLVTGGGQHVAVRCPDHPMALELLRECGFPLVGPSANKSGKVSPTTAQHVIESFGDEVTVLDGGSCKAGIESTVLALDGTPRVLRRGVIGASDISRLLGKPVSDHSSAHAPDSASITAGVTPLPSPGLLDVHYAPSKPAFLLMPGDLPRLLRDAQGSITVVTHEDTSVPPPHHVIRLPKHARAYAAGLYAALRAADRSPSQIIAVQTPPDASSIADEAVWSAVIDRLSRATKPFSPATPPSP